MRFSLLTPPTDAPSRIPLSRGLPSASALQVETGYLPRALPLPQMDVEGSAAPMQALARFAATGGQVSEQLSNLVVAAEAKKRELENLAVTTALFNEASERVDTGLEDLKTKTTHNTLRPAYNDLWKNVTQEVFAKAPNRDVQVALGVKLTGLRTVKSGEVSDTVRTKLVDFHEADLETQSRAAAKAITDPNTTEAEREIQIRNIESFYHGHANMGLLKPDRIERVRDRTLTTSFNTLAQQALAKDPDAFLPKSEDNPDGQDGYREFSATGKYPADPKYLNTLIDTTGPNLVAKRNTEKRLADERREAQFDKMMKFAWETGYDQLVKELDSGDPARVTGATTRVEQMIEDSGPYWSQGMKTTVRTYARDTRKAGGTTVDARHNDLQTKMLERPGSVTVDEILKYAGSELALTGDRSASSLIMLQRQLLKSDDVSQRPDYRQGHEILVTLSAGATDMMALYGPGKAIFGPADAAKNRVLYGNALAEFDRLARTPEWANKNLRELGLQVRDKFMPLIYPDYKPTSTGQP